MKKIINHLIQLQELSLVREQEAFMGGERLKQLDESISGLHDQLPEDVRGIFRKLQKRDTVAVAQVSAGVCSTCGMRLPISMVQAVRAQQRLTYCPNCSRILYCSDTLPRSTAKRQSRTAPPKIGIERFSAQELMVPRLAAEDRDGAIRELTAKMQEQAFVEHADKLVEAVLLREAIISTALDHGLAFPHARGIEGGGLTMALGISVKGIRFEPQNKALTHVIFLMAIPTAANAFYLRLLAGLTETFRAPDALAELMAEDDSKKLWKTLKRLTKKTIP